MRRLSIYRAVAGMFMFLLGMAQQTCFKTRVTQSFLSKTRAVPVKLFMPSVKDFGTDPFFMLRATKRDAAALAGKCCKKPLTGTGKIWEKFYLWKPATEAFWDRCWWCWMLGKTWKNSKPMKATILCWSHSGWGLCQGNNWTSSTAKLLWQSVTFMTCSYSLPGNT